LIPLLISLIGIALVIALYHRQPGGLTLRVLAILLLWALATNFSLNIKIKKPPQRPALLIDCSKSLERYFEDVCTKLDSINFPHTRYFFAESLYTAGHSIAAQGEFTNITRAIMDISHTNPGALLLISDGNHNFGESPLSLSEELSFPIFCFGVGTEAKKDISISKVLYPEYASLEDTIKLRVEIESRGFAQGMAEVRVQSSIKTKEKTTPLSDVVARNWLEFEFYPKKLGTEKFKVTIAPKAGEYAYENNEQSFSIKVLQSHIKVLYYTDHISFNTRFILKSLGADKYLDPIAVARLRDREYIDIIKEEPVGFPQLEGYDVIILDNVRLSQLPLEGLKKFLTENGGVLFIGSCEGPNYQWNEILPIHTTNRYKEGRFVLKIITPFSNLSSQEYPPLSCIGYTLGTASDAVVIAEANHAPVIAYKNYQNNIVFQINIMNLGIWNFLQVGIKQHDVLSPLLSDIIRFLSATSGHNRLVLQSAHRDYNIGDKITLRLQSYNHNYKIKGGGDFYVEFDNRKVPFFEIAKGIYEATIIPSKKGEFELCATGTFNEETLESNRLKINVFQQTKEIDIGLNHELLTELSKMSGGQYLSLDQLAKFSLPKFRETYTTKKLDFNSPYIYLAIFGLLAIDWFLRRRRGMI